MYKNDRTYSVRSWVAAAALLPVFMRVGRRMPLRDDDRATMWRAARSKVEVPGIRGAGAEAVVYEWGHGPRTVVLAHGWQGRASQWATLVRDLVFEGYRVVAFDAPAHGESPGRRTYLIDWMDVLRRLQDRYGRFHAVVGHSFGALGVLLAVSEGVETERVVTVAAPAGADSLLREFQTAMRLDDATAAALRERFAWKYFPGERQPLARLSAVRHPLPASTDLLVAHDRDDRRIPHSEAARIVDVNPDAQALSTTGLGHSRILAADAFLDATIEFLTSVRAEPRGSGRLDASGRFVGQ